MDTNIQNISGGVGEAYPGSTGGEFFNYYGDDADKNIASGDYSTAIGKKCVAVGKYSIVGGYGNTTSGTTSNTSIIFGKENSSYGGGYIIGSSNGKTHVVANCYIFGESNNSYSNDGTRRADGVMIGYNNAISGYYKTMIFGHNNKATSDNASGPEVIVGNYLTPLSGHLKETVLLGQYNNTTSVLSTPVVIIAAGASGAGNRKNAIEIDTSQCKILHDLQLATDTTAVNAIDTPKNTPASTTDKTLATLGSFQKRYQSWYSSIVFTPDVAKSTADLPSGFQAALYQATEAEFTGTYGGVQVRAKFRLSPNSDETILTNPVVCYNTDNGTYSHTRGFILKLEKSSSAVTITMQRGTSIDFENNNNTFNSYVDSTTTFNISYIQLKMTNF